MPAVPVEEEGIIVSSIATMTDAELQSAIEDQITADETDIKALATAQDSAYGASVLIVMPGETTPRFLTEEELTAVEGEADAAADALALLGTVGAGEQVVIAQGASFQMVAFLWTWTV